ncbi:hypothetical protein PFISCL1PPCAC_8535, partial [Pristionchus fissidentatus]
RMSNFVVLGDKAYTWSECELWSLHLLGFVWDIVDVDGEMPCLRPNGALLSRPDTQRGVLELSLLYRPLMMYAVRYTLGGDPPQTTVIDDHPVTSEELDDMLIETWNRIIDEEEAAKNQEKQARIDQLREEDGKNDARSLVYSRRCGICLNDNPVQRAVFTSCGHFSCLACALQISNEEGRFVCPFCRKE